MGERVRILHGDCLAVLPTLPADSVHAVVTDPPYHLTSIVKRFGAEKAAPAISATQRRFNKTGAAMSLGVDGQPTPDQYGRLSRGFMGKQWDGGDIAFRPDLWREVLRVLKPGGHVLAFGGTRTYHRLACAVEDAGFEIRDAIMWHYGSGFPKSHSVSGAIDRMNGIGPRGKAFNMKGRGDRAEELDANGREFLPPYEPATDAAREWQGWGTALKPATEIIVLARKPLGKSTVAANVLAFGTGALNIGACRVGTDGGTAGASKGPQGAVYGDGLNGAFGERVPGLGRWPANVLHDGSEEVLRAFPDGRSAGQYPSDSTARNGVTDFGGAQGPLYSDQGSAARYFYTAKADSADRLGSKHPTVKPVDLIAYLCRLICPPGGTILDPFAGSGTLAFAAMREGFNAILIEKEAEYVADIRRRIAHVSGQDAPLFAGAAT